MAKALIVSAGNNANEYLARHIGELGYTRPTIVASGGDARRRMDTNDFEVVIINTPLPDEFGHELGTDAVEKTDAGVILLAKTGTAFLGTNCADCTTVPVLIQLIDAKQDLSIQVHPSNEYALEHDHQYGKTEMWYVLEAEPGASLYYGFTHEISKEEFERRIQDNTLTDALNAVPVHKGDCFFIPSGTLHAIRKGIVVAEIQQNSNVTYRIYDYGHLGADGKPRQLHIPQALDVTLREPPKAQDFHGHLAQCDYFTVDAVEGEFEDVCDETSFTSLLVLEGRGTLTETATGESLPIRKGQSLFLPAGTGAYAVTGTALKCLRTRV